VERERSAAAAMLGLPGFVVLAVSDNDGELEQAVTTSRSPRAGLASGDRGKRLDDLRAPGHHFQDQLTDVDCRQHPAHSAAQAARQPDRSWVTSFTIRRPKTA